MPATKARQVMFQHKRDNHTVTVEPADYVFAQNGRVIGETKGRRIHFERHVYRTSDEAEIALLRSRMDPESELFDPGLFEVEQIAPDPSSILVELATASEGRTRQILEEELEGWERPAVLQACEAKLAQANAGFEPEPEFEPEDDPEAPFGRKADGTARKRPVPPHLQR